MFIHPRPKPRRKSIIRYANYLWRKHFTVDLQYNDEYYLSRALVDLATHSRTPEAKIVYKHRYYNHWDLETLANITFDLLKTSLVYNKDEHCYEFMEDNLIPYYEVDNTKTGTYIL